MNEIHIKAKRKKTSVALKKMTGDFNKKGRRVLLDTFGYVVILIHVLGI